MGPRRPVLQTYPAAEAALFSVAPLDFGSGPRAIFRRVRARNLRFPSGLILQAAPIVGAESKSRVFAMLGWVVTFLIVALVAGVLGFGGVAGASIEIAKIIFFIAVVLFLVSALVGVARGRTRI
jgi:uncharacterized membrane protein YtjA (UPF0391 family)